jgi:hypothetical protein
MEEVSIEPAGGQVLTALGVGGWRTMTVVCCIGRDGSWRDSTDQLDMERRLKHDKVPPRRCSVIIRYSSSSNRNTWI